MFPQRYFPQRYFPRRYWTKSGSLIDVCVYVPGPRNRFGTNIKFGTCLKFGDGFSDPWYPIGNTDPRYEYEEGTAVIDRDDATLLSIDNRDELSIDYGGVPDEVFYLESPNGTIFKVTIYGANGHIDVEGGTAEDFAEGPNLQIALLEADMLWEPGLPLDSTEIGLAEQLQLLWGYPRTEIDSAVSGNPVDKYIVSLDGELWQLRVLDTGELEFTDEFQTHDAETAFTPAYTEE